MKINEVNNLLTKTIYNEVKKAIIAENDGNKKDYYHVMLDGKPIDTFETQEEADNYVSKIKDKYTGKNLIVDKKHYNSYSDMIDALDELNDKINNEENNNKMKKKLREQEEMYNSFDEEYTEELNYFGDKDQFEEEEEMCTECGDGAMEEEMYEMDDDMVYDSYNMEEEMDEVTQDTVRMEDDMYETDFVDERMFDTQDMEEETYEMDDDLYEGKEFCMECGSMLNEGGECNECGKSSLYESRKKKIRLTESELTKLIKEMVLESIPGLTATNNSRKGSKKDSEDYYGEVNSKMKKYLQFEGNDNPEFPNQIRKGEQVKRENTQQQDDEVAKNKAGLQNLEYDVEPSEQFKKRAQMAIEGHPHMGNAATTDKSTIKPSNGSKKAKDAKEKSGNQMKTKTADKIKKQVKDREKDSKSRVIYKKEQVPVKTKTDKKESVNESVNKKELLNEMERMKQLSSYNKKTQ